MIYINEARAKQVERLNTSIGSTRWVAGPDRAQASRVQRLEIVPRTRAWLREVKARPFYPPHLAVCSHQPSPSAAMSIVQGSYHATGAAAWLLYDVGGCRETYKNFDARLRVHPCRDIGEMLGIDPKGVLPCGPRGVLSFAY